MFISGFAEIITIGSVVPFIAAITNPDKVLEFPYLADLFFFFKVVEPKEIVMFIATLFCGAVIFSSCLRLLISKLNYKWSYDLAADLGTLVFEKTLRQNFLVHSMRNSSEIISGITIKTGNLLGAMILPIMTAFQLTILIFSIFLTLCFVLPVNNIVSLFCFVLIYALISILMKRKLNNNSKIIALHQAKGIKILQESLNGIRDVILGNSFNFYKKKYAISEKEYRSGLGRNAFLALAPRYLIEALGILLIVALALFAFNESPNRPENVLPAIGLLALSAQRMLPYLQQLYAAYSGIVGNLQSNEDALNLLEQEFNIESKLVDVIVLNDNLKLEDIDFAYKDKRNFQLSNINLSINRGDFIGIIGSTGSGKSTLVDLIMGLIFSDNGSFYVDGKLLNEENAPAWRKNIIHVPQNIFISDASIENNIALGVSKKSINKEKIEKVLKISCLEEFVNSSPERLNTKVGESGSQLSGGQRQRIAIARALYREGDILILDEATNSLDFKTEEKILSNIKDMKNKTIISVIHNLQKLKTFNQIIIMDEGKIVSSGNYEETIKTDAFKKLSKNNSAF
jgi:ATP-binding cassette subfamily B protein